MRTRPFPPGINWVQHLKKQGITYWVVGATDSKTSEYLSSNEDRHPCFKFWEGDHDANAHGEYKYGSDHYREATWRKVWGQACMERARVGKGAQVPFTNIDITSGVMKTAKRNHRTSLKIWDADKGCRKDHRLRYNTRSPSPPLTCRALPWPVFSRQVTVVEKIVDWGFNVLHSDVDVIWFRDPLPYVIGPALANVDVAMSTDLISTQNDVGDEGLEVNVHQHVNFNTGVYFVKASPVRGERGGWEKGGGPVGVHQHVNLNTSFYFVKGVYVGGLVDGRKRSGKGRTRITRMPYALCLGPISVPCDLLRHRHGLDVGRSGLEAHARFLDGGRGDL
eukprot:353631-Chlamydomonas_euryale.AAC.12